MGLQVLAYGGEKPAPFHRAICQPQALEAGTSPVAAGVVAPY